MKHHSLTLLVLATLAPLGSRAAILTNEHVDIGLAYEAGAWDLHVHDETNGIEYQPPTDAVIFAGNNAMTTVPNLPAYSFLGAPGADIWVLPKVEDFGLPFLGIGAEELDPANWQGNVFLALKGVSGPGNFFAWDVDGFGAPIVVFNSQNGINGADLAEVIPGSHQHLNWAFTAPGSYLVAFEASGTHLADGFVSSGAVDYTFETSVSAVPEPAITGLIAGAAMCGLVVAQKLRRKS